MGSVDIVLNPEPGLSGDRYDARMRSLLGESYCLLRSGFSEGRDGKEDWEEGRIPIFVMMGGSDAFGLSALTLRVLARLDPERIAPVLVCGEASRCSDEVESLLTEFDRSEKLVGLDSVGIAAWMRRCKLGVIGCGSSVFEMAALGVPFVGLQLVDNQERTARAIEQRWGIPIVEREEDRRMAERLGIEVGRLIERLGSGWRPRFEGIDCWGARRVLEAIEGGLGRA